MSDRVSAIRGSGYVWPGKLKRPPFTSGVKRQMWNIRRRWNVSRIEFRMWDIRRRWNIGHTKFFPGWNELCRASQGGSSACARCRDPSPWWHGVRIAIRSNSIQIPQEDTSYAPLFGLPQGEAHDTCEHHTPDDCISYPDMLSGSLTKVSKPFYVIPPACHNPCSSALRWCVRTPCLDIFCHGFQRTLLNLGLLWWSKSYQNTKLNTIWLELIARALNMLIGLEGDNYYSKVFKIVNYKLSNNTFWVVISHS